MEGKICRAREQVRQVGQVGQPRVALPEKQVGQVGQWQIVVAVGACNAPSPLYFHRIHATLRRISIIFLVFLKHHHSFCILIGFTLLF